MNPAILTPDMELVACPIGESAEWELLLGRVLVFTGDWAEMMELADEWEYWCERTRVAMMSPVLPFPVAA